METPRPPSRKRQLEMMRGAHGGHCRSRTPEGVEQPPQAVLDVLVRIENAAPAALYTKPTGKRI
jgi:hypothetical protein